jgi:hypothetical protein
MELTANHPDLERRLRLQVLEAWNGFAQPLGNLAGCGKSNPGAWQLKHLIVELFYAWRRHSTIYDVQLPVT